MTRRTVALVLCLVAATVPGQAGTIIGIGSFGGPLVTFGGAAANPYLEAGFTFSDPFFLGISAGALQTGFGPLSLTNASAWNSLGFTSVSGATLTSIDFYSDGGFTTLVDSYATPVVLGPGGFFGIQSNGSFQSVRISISSFSTVDDFRFNAQQISTAPEPSAGSLALLGLAGIPALLTWRKRRRTS